MFYSQQIKRGDGIWQTNFFLTQGDLAVLTAEPIFENLDYDASDIASTNGVVFVMSNADMVQEFTKAFTLTDDHYVLTLLSSETTNFTSGTHNYELVYNFADGNSFTSNTGTITILTKSTSAGE